MTAYMEFYFRLLSRYHLLTPQYYVVMLEVEGVEPGDTPTPDEFRNLNWSALCGLYDHVYTDLPDCLRPERPEFLIEPMEPEDVEQPLECVTITCRYNPDDADRKLDMLDMGDEEGLD